MPRSGGDLQSPKGDHPQVETLRRGRIQRINATHTPKRKATPSACSQLMMERSLRCAGPPPAAAGVLSPAEIAPEPDARQAEGPRTPRSGSAWPNYPAPGSRTPDRRPDIPCDATPQPCSPLAPMNGRSAPANAPGNPSRRGKRGFPAIPQLNGAPSAPPRDLPFVPTAVADRTWAPFTWARPVWAVSTSAEPTRRPGGTPPSSGLSNPSVAFPSLECGGWGFGRCSRS
jgi:hypothetical protein